MVAQDPHQISMNPPDSGSVPPGVDNVACAEPPSVVPPSTTLPTVQSTPPSGAAAVWIALTLLNVGLLILVVPDALLQNVRLAFVIKVVSGIGALGAIAAVLIWFQHAFTSLPKYLWFRTTQVVALCVLGLLNLSQLPLIPLYPVLDPGSKVEVDGQKHAGGTIRVSLGPHTVRVGTSTDAEGKLKVSDDGGKVKEYSLGYKQVLLAVLSNYTDPWDALDTVYIHPLYAVYIQTDVPKVDVEIRRTDGDFNPEFSESAEPEDPPPGIERKPGTNNVVIWHSGNSRVGTDIRLYLPHGEYTFTGRKEGCEKVIPKSIKHVEKGGHIIELGSLCTQP